MYFFFKYTTNWVSIMQKLNKNSFILIAKYFEKKMVAVCHFVKKNTFRSRPLSYDG